jgi:antitoxin component HigA of HigAB toxin-antitoxin module
LRRDHDERGSHADQAHRDHEEALARIEQIFSAKPGTPEFDELDVRATLVAAYEDIHYPIDPLTPSSGDMDRGGVPGDREGS